jgi:hypothetical protein
VTWSTEVLDELVRSALLGYLAVAHYGRGRGDWSQAEHPDFWQEHVDAVVERDKDALVALWKQREIRGASPERDDTTAAARALAGSLRIWFEKASAALLARLYPRANLRPESEPQASRAAE